MKHKLKQPYILVPTLLLFTALMLGLSCSSKSPSEPDDDSDFNTILTQTIGPQGGEIIADNLTISIPPAALSQSTEIIISASTIENPFGDQQTTPLYRIEGLGNDYSKPIRIALKIEGDAASPSLLALGDDALSSNNLSTGYTFLSSSDSAGYLVTELPVMLADDDNATDGLLKVNAADDPIPKIVRVENYLIHKSSQNHFWVYYPLSGVNQSRVEDIGNYLEEAFQTILNLGFNYSLRTQWPVKVTVKKMPASIDGAAYRSTLGRNFGYLEFNIDKLDDTKQLRLTAGHEFFHLVQALYDYRYTSIQWAKGFPTHYWFDESASAWIEEKFSTKTNFFSATRLGNEMTPFAGAHLDAPVFSYPFGLNADAIEAVQKHGYGLSALVKYLVDLYGERIVIDIYKQLYMGEHIVDAFSTIDPGVWWDDFLIEYMLSNIYDDVGRNTWYLNSSGIFEVNAKKDTLAEFTESYQDLSGKIYRVILKYPDLKPNSNLYLDISGASERKMSLFTYIPFQGLKYIKSDRDHITIENINTFINNGFLFVLVSNNRYEKPYTSEHEITLNMQITQANSEQFSDYSKCQLEMFVQTVYQRYINNEPQGDPFSQEYVWPLTAKGSVTGNTFKADYNDNSGMFVGTLEAQLNDAHDQIISLQWTHEYTSSPSYQKTVVNATNIPSQSGAGQAVFELTGSQVCNSLELDYTQTYLNTETVLEQINCNANSYVKVTFSKP